MCVLRLHRRARRINAAPRPIGAFALRRLDRANERGQRVLRPDGNSGICLGRDELHAPAQLTENQRDGEVEGGREGERPALKLKNAPPAVAKLPSCQQHTCKSSRCFKCLSC